jgi:hypothetical protein
MDRKEIGCGGVQWLHMAPDSVHWWFIVKAVMNLRIS